MQGATLRALILAGILSVGVAFYWAGRGGDASAEGRWPEENAVYRVDGWLVGEPSILETNGVDYVSRPYGRPNGQTGILTVATSPSAKAIYRAGADVPYLGSGFAIESAPGDLVPAKPGRAAFLVRQGSQTGLVMYAFGERRGLLGNGALAWTFVGLDALLGRPNDYFRISMVVPYDSTTMQVSSDFVELTDTLLPRLASWYASGA